MSTWEIVARPEGKNDDDKNEGGMIVLLKNGSAEEEVGRVAFERANSLHPDVEFDDQLDKELGKAVRSLAAIRELTSGSKELQ